MNSNSKKIVLLGHFGVGKTSLIRRFVHNTFSDSYKVSIGVSISKKVVSVYGSKKVSLILWDIEGTDDIQNLRESYLIGLHGIYYVFDVNRPSTYVDIDNNLQDLKTRFPNSNIKVVGNKMDKLSPDMEKGHNELEEVTFDYLTSAKTGENVEESFLNIAKELTQI